MNSGKREAPCGSNNERNTGEARGGAPHECSDDVVQKEKGNLRAFASSSTPDD